MRRRPEVSGFVAAKVCKVSGKVPFAFSAFLGGSIQPWNPEGHEDHGGEAARGEAAQALLDRGRALLPCRLLSWRWRTLQGTLGFLFA